VLRQVLTLLLLVSASPALAQQATPASIRTTSGARDLFERDWVLMNWALKFHDSDHDVMLEPSEAQTAADEFRKMADTNGDGRITPDEYRAARAFILARY
jgi:hypothetical protein